MWAHISKTSQKSIWTHPIKFNALKHFPSSGKKGRMHSHVLCLSEQKQWFDNKLAFHNFVMVAQFMCAQVFKWLSYADSPASMQRAFFSPEKRDDVVGQKLLQLSTGKEICWQTLCGLRYFDIFWLPLYIFYSYFAVVQLCACSCSVLSLKAKVMKKPATQPEADVEERGLDCFQRPRG